MKETKTNNRPRVEWKDGKMVTASTPNKARTTPVPARTAVKNKPAEEIRTAKTVKPAKPVRQNHNREYSNENDILDFFISLKSKRHIVVAFFVILALSVTVAAVAVSLADSETLTPPVDVEVDNTPPALPENNVVAPMDVDEGHTGHGHAVCIDPGHGFDDEGTANPELGVYEKDVVLSVSLKLRDKLEDKGIKVYMTHDTNAPPVGSSDPYLFGMKKRTSLANSFSDVALYISIHCDAYYEDTSVSGSRIFYMSDELDSEKVASEIAAALENAGSEKKPITKGMSGMNSYQVLRDTDMAAVLVETGFVSNEDEAKAMLTDEWVEYMAEALAQAIEKSFEDKII